MLNEEEAGKLNKTEEVEVSKKLPKYKDDFKRVILSIVYNIPLLVVFRYLIAHCYLHRTDYFLFVCSVAPPPPVEAMTWAGRQLFLQYQYFIIIRNKDAFALR